MQLDNRRNVGLRWLMWLWGKMLQLSSRATDGAV